MPWALFSITTLVITAAGTPRPVGQHVPERYQYNCTNQRPEDGDASNRDIANTSENNDLCHQPDTYKASNYRAEDSKREPPANEEFGNKSDNRPNDQVHDEIATKSPGIIAKPYSDAIRENSTVNDEMEHALLL